MSAEQHTGRRHDDTWAELILTAAVLVGAILLALLVFAPADTRCVEDDSCWRCEDMGNRRCGP